MTKLILNSKILMKKLSIKAYFQIDSYMMGKL